MRVTAGCLKKHRDKWNAVKFSKSLRHAAVQSFDSFAQQAALNGQGIFRVDKVWDVPERPTAQEELREAKRGVNVACACLRLPSICHGVARRVVDAKLPLCGCFKRERRHFRRIQAAYDTYYE